MGQVFLSYASADRDRAQRLAEAMQGKGYQVWWDRQIAPGKTFDEVIESELNTAACVVVLWSSTSVKSDWVKTEASEAASRRILVPVLIDNVRIPLEFRRVQAADLTKWDGSFDDPEFGKFLRAVDLEIQENLQPASSEAAAAVGIGSISRATHPAAAAPNPQWAGQESAPVRRAAPATRQPESLARSTMSAGRWRVAAWALAALSAAVVIAGLMFWLNRGANVLTPNVVGMSYEEAAAALTAVSLSPQRRDQPSDAGAPESVVAQRPPAGTTLARAATVSLTVALPARPPVSNVSTASIATSTPDAPQPVAPATPVVPVTTTPDLRGQTPERAVELLASAGLTMGVKKDAASNDVSLGSIVSQEPEAAQTLAKGSPVSITVAVNRILPELVGLNLQQAHDTLTKLGLKERVERVRASARETDNHVLAQTPLAGKEIDAAGEVVLTIAIVTPKKVAAGESLLRVTGQQRCNQVCRDTGLKWTREWSGTANTCTCDF